MQVAPGLGGPAGLRTAHRDELAPFPNCIAPLPARTAFAGYRIGEDQSGGSARHFATGQLAHCKPRRPTWVKLSRLEISAARVLTPETGHCSAWLARQKSAKRRPNAVQQLARS